MSTAFRILMNGAQEVPTPSGSSATGLGTVIFDDVAVTASYVVTVTGVDFGPVLGQPAQTANPNDNVTALHVHNAPPGANGGHALGLIAPGNDANFAAVINPNGSTTFSGLWDASDASGSINTYAAALAGAAVGSSVDLYVNLHTSGFPGGEIRGQWVCIADDNANNVAGTGGADILPGLGGNDTINGFGANDRVLGGDSRDRLTGGNGIDTLQGGTGKDSLRGDAGGDNLAGGGGKDKFIFQLISDSLTTARDSIFDFNSGAGETIDVSAIDARPSAVGDQAFLLVAAFGGNEGEAVLTFLGGPNKTTLELDTNGDGVGDFELIINGDQTGAVGFVL